jgi:uncharacterized membrane protein
VRALIFGLVGIAALLLLPDLGPGPLNATDPVVRATVIAVRGEQVEVQLLEGPRAGERLTLPAGDEADTMVALPEAGEEYLVYLPQPGDATPAALAERYRFVPMLIAAAVVAFAAVAIGGAAGIRSLVALLFSGLLILRVTIPLLLTGAPALPVAMGSAITVAATTILIARGPGRSAAAAIIGMTIALTIAAAASEGAAALAGLSDIRGAADLYPLIGVLPGIDIAGLSMAAVLITATALIDDVAVTQVAAVEQLRLADRRMSDATVTAQAMAVGRAHAGALLNTIVIVWIGGSLPLVAALTMAGERADIILSTEVVAAELLRIAAGVIGTIAAIPATTYAAVRLGVGRP